MTMDKNPLFYGAYMGYCSNLGKQQWLVYSVYEQRLYKYVVNFSQRKIVMIEPATEEEMMDVETAMKTNFLRSSRKPIPQEQMHALILQGGPVEKESVNLKIPTHILNRVKIKALAYDMGYQNMIKFLVVRGLDNC